MTCRAARALTELSPLTSRNMPPVGFVAGSIAAPCEFRKLMIASASSADTVPLPSTSRGFAEFVQGVSVTAIVVSAVLWVGSTLPALSTALE